MYSSTVLRISLRLKGLRVSNSPNSTQNGSKSSMASLSSPCHPQSHSQKRDAVKFHGNYLIVTGSDVIGVVVSAVLDEELPDEQNNFSLEIRMSFRLHKYLQQGRKSADILRPYHVNLQRVSPHRYVGWKTAPLPSVWWRMNGTD